MKRTLILADTRDLKDNEQIECRITVCGYHFIFAYMMAPASATVVNIEMILKI